MNDAPAQEAAASPLTDPAKAHVVAEWKHDSPLIACRLSPDGRWAFSSAEDNKVQRWSMADGALTLYAGPHDSWVRAIGFSRDGATVLTAGCDGRLVWWPAGAEQPEPTRVVDAHQGWVRALDVSPDGSLVATAGNDLVARLWNLADGSLVREFSGHEKHLYSVQFHPSGETLFTGDLAGVVRQWNVAGDELKKLDAKTLHTYNGGQRVDFGGVRSISVDAANNRLATGGLYEASNPLGSVHEPIIEVFDLETGEKVVTHTDDKKLRGGVWRVVHHVDGYVLAGSGGADGGWLYFWRPAEEKPFAKFKLPNIVRDMDLHVDNVRVATAHHDGRLRITELRAAAPA